MADKSNTAIGYLQEGLYPSWFKRSGPPSTIGSMPGAPSRESVSSVGQWPTLKAQHVASIPGWHKVKPEDVSSKPGTLPPKPQAPSDDGWAEIGQPYFGITVDGQHLGYWAKLDGLGFKLEIAEHRTGDGYNYRWIEPTFYTVPNLKLARAATAKGCKQVLAWLLHAQYAWTKGMTAIVEAKPLWHRTNPGAHFKIALADVMPVAWTGPNFATDGKIAMETLELAFSGFLPPEGASPVLTVPPPYEGRKEPTPPAPPPKRDFTPKALAPTEKTSFAPTR